MTKCQSSLLGTLFDFIKYHPEFLSGVIQSSSPVSS